MKRCLLLFAVVLSIVTCTAQTNDSMMELKFFRCPHCGNVIVKMADSGVPVVCCGEKMQELQPNTSDGAGEKHLPVISQNAESVTVTVSTVEHPSVDAHYIQFIVLQTTSGYEVKFLKPGMAPKALFGLSYGDVVVAAYEYCNLHGLWKAAVK